MNKVVILSGGLDSTILLYKVHSELKAGEKLFALTFNYGQRHSIEIDKSRLSCAKLGVEQRIIDISFLGDIVSPVCSLSDSKEVAMPNIEDVLGDAQPPTYVPFRNQILASIGYSFAEVVEADEIYMGLQCHDLYSYWDTSDDFVNAMNEVTKLNRLHNIQLVAPFLHWNKAQEIELANTLNVPFEDTWTCYTGVNDAGEEVACGTCPSCSERIMNFIKAGEVDPVKYAIDIDWTCK